MAVKNAIYAQSGGVTAVINTSAAAVIEQVRKYPDKIGKLFAAKNGILGVLNKELFDTSTMSQESITSISETPGGVFGSCRYKFKDINEDITDYQTIIDTFKQLDIGYFFYNGGNDSADTCLKISNMAKELNYPLNVVHIPKTIDNDLEETDNCPGFGSVAKYVAVSTAEASLDLASMSATSTKVFIMEVMGRHTGWIAASASLVKTTVNSAPHITLLPERRFNPDQFLTKVKDTITEIGFCVVVASEGIKDSNGNLLTSSLSRDAFGHAQLGGVAPALSTMIHNKLNAKTHWAVLDYLQRSARHLVSKTDVEQAYAVAEKAVDYAVEGYTGVMSAIHRISDSPYQWEINMVNLEQVANKEKKLPDQYISNDGYQITEQGIKYLSPLIQGEQYPIFKSGLPTYSKPLLKVMDLSS